MNVVDKRIPVVAGTPADARAGDYVLHPPAGGAPAHIQGCACCQPRAVLARALTDLYLGWVRGHAPPPRRIVVVGDAASVAATFGADALLQARFRFAGAA